MAAPQDEITPQWQSYIDLANDIKPYLQIPATDTTRDGELQDLIDAACAWAQDTLGRPIAPTTFFRRFSGWTGLNGAYISLPYYPVLQTPTAMTVVEYWGSSGPHTLVEQTPAAQGGSDMYTLDALRGQVIRSFMGLVPRPWFPGLRNIEITWSAGFNPVPRHWVMATKELVKYWWVNTQQSSRSFVKDGEGYGQQSADYALWPAVPDRISLMFQTAIQVGIG